MLSEKPWKPEAVARLLLGIFAGVFVGFLLLMLVRSGRPAEPTPKVWQSVATMLIFQGAILAFVWRFVRAHGLGWSGLFGFTLNRKQAILLGIGTAMLFLPVGLGLKVMSARVLTGLGLPVEKQAAVELLHGAGAMELAVMFLAAVALAPLAEEFLFRGVMYPLIKDAGHPHLALWGSSLSFAVIHVNLVTLLPLLVLAIVLVRLYEWTGNLLATIAAHTTFNALNFGLFFLLQHGPDRLPTQP